jgi:hypothetical protein
VRAGGRCEFDNCNEYLLEHKPTGTPVNVGDKSHIWAFRKTGPRGRSKGRPTEIHELANLMLLCKSCHHTVDKFPERYTVDVLRKFKNDHEQRIFDLTGLAKDRDTVPLVLKGLIDNRAMEISDDEMQRAVAPNYLRLREKIDIDLLQLPDSADSHYWASAKAAVDRGLNQLALLQPRGKKPTHVSVFALAAIPLLAYLGSKISDKIRVDLYQRHRNPESWNWRDGVGEAHFKTRKLKDGGGQIALAINVSGTIPSDAIDAASGDCTLYELALTGQQPSPLVLNARDDLARFVSAYIAALEIIRTAHPGLQLLQVFPAVPAPIAITLGRHILPKVGPKLLIFDHDRRSGTFIPTITIG